VPVLNAVYLAVGVEADSSRDPLALQSNILGGPVAIVIALEYSKLSTQGAPH